MSKNHYELTYIVNPVLEESDAKAAVEKINKLITDNGGEIEEVEEPESEVDIDLDGSDKEEFGEPENQDTDDTYHVDSEIIHANYECHRGGYRDICGYVTNIKNI